MAYVYAFDHKHRRPPMELKDLLGGKGANLAEMTSVLGLPVPPGFTITTDACRAYLAGGWPDGLDDEIAKQVRTLEKAMGRKLGDPSDPLLVSVRSGAKFSMPGMMDTVLNLGLNDDRVRGPGRTHRATSASPTTPTAGSSRCTAASCSGIEAARLRRAASTRPRPGPASPATPRCPPRYLEAAVRASTRRIVQAEHGIRLPAGARGAAARRHRGRVHAAGTAPGPSPTGCASASATTSAPRSTCRPWCSATGTTTPAPASGFTRNAATGETKPYGDFLVNAQGEDVVAGIRNTEDLDAHGPTFPTIHERAARHLRTPRAALPRHVRHGVHHRAGQALDAPDPRRQAHRRGGAAHGRRHDRRTGTSSSRAKRRCSASPPTTSTRCCTRSSPAGDAAGARHRPRRLARARPSARRTSPPTTPSTPPTGARTSSSCATRPVARGRARHAGVAGHPHRARAASSATPPWSPAAGASRRWSAPRPIAHRRRRVHRRRRHGRTRATSSRSTAPPARSSSARCSWPRPSRPPSSTCCWAGPTRSARASSACGPTPTTGPTPPTPASSAPRASACAAPSTCSSARTACRSCGA